jgi:hypothetical protein
MSGGIRFAFPPYNCRMVELSYQAWRQGARVIARRAAPKRSGELHQAAGWIATPPLRGGSR